MLSGVVVDELGYRQVILFQWAPTLGGECYPNERTPGAVSVVRDRFQWAPTLGGECYRTRAVPVLHGSRFRFNGHPPLGVNAT